MHTKRIAGTALFLLAANAIAACTVTNEEADGGKAGSSAASSGGSGGSSEAGSAGQSGSSAAGSAGQSGSSAAGAAGAAGSAGATLGGSGGATAGAGGATAGAGGATAGAGGATAGAGGTAGGAAGGAAGAPDTSKFTWKEVTSPCNADFINALAFDDANRGYIGCGNNIDGKGLHLTTDGGKTWKAQPKFADMDVFDVRRGSDGVLYAAGSDSSTAANLVSIDESLPNNLKPVVVHVGPGAGPESLIFGENVVRSADGKLLVDSANRSAVSLRMPGKEFVDYATLHEDAIAKPDSDTAFNPRRIQAFGNDFYGAGSTPNGPATVYVPSKKTSPAYHFASVALQSAGEEGELFDLHVWSPTSLIAVGWDTTFELGLVYVCDGDPSLKASWKQIDLGESGITYKLGINDLAVSGDRVLAVGNKIGSGANGFVLESLDKGKTWKDITATVKVDPVARLYRVLILPDGKVIAGNGLNLNIFGPLRGDALPARRWGGRGG